MAIVRRRDRDLEPRTMFDRLQEEINQLFDVSWFDEPRGIFERAVSPPMDVYEDEDAVTVVCDLPGIQQKDIDITIGGGVLTVKGEKGREEPPGAAKMYRREIWEGKFQRTISLPPTVDAGKVDATFTDGVLRIGLPKTEEAKPKKIELRVK